MGGIRRDGRQKKMVRKKTNKEKRKEIVTENSQLVPSWGTFTPPADAITGMQRQVR